MPTEFSVVAAIVQLTQPPAPLAVELIKIIVTSVLACLFGAVGAYVAARFKIQELTQTFNNKVQELKTQFALQREEDRTKTEARLRDKFLSPLLFATNELIERLQAIVQKLDDWAERGQMLGWFNEVEREKDDKPEFERWCNDCGHFAVTTLYITSAYFGYANRILTEAPFYEVHYKYSTELSRRLSAVRESMSSPDGIWRESQESVGRLLTKDERVLSYSEYCSLLSDPSKFVWFLILLNFYRKLDSGKKSILAGIILALSELRAFLDLPSPP